MRPLLLLAALLVACNPDPYPGEEGTWLHVGLRLLPKTTDPPRGGEEGSVKLISNLYEGLLTYHPYARPYQLMPQLAAEMPEVSEDKRTYTFRLRSGVLFQDDPCFPEGRGRELTANDFLFAFKRLAHPTTQARGWWLFDGRIEGLNDWRDQIAEGTAAARAAGEAVGPLWGLERSVPGFEVIDDYTLRFHLTDPYPQFLWTLAMPYAVVYPREAVEHYGERFGGHPVGTGPFQMIEYNPVYRAVYRANPTFREVRVPDPERRAEERWPGWEDDVAAGLLAHAGERIPLVDGMESRFLLEDQPRWLYFKSGYIDFLNPPKDNVAEAIPLGELSAEMAARGVRLARYTELGTVYTSLNTEDALLSNVDVRRAVALAFNHRWTVDHLYGGQAIVAKSLVPPGVAGYTDYHPYHTEDGEAQYEAAREMLARAGYPGGIDPETGRALRIRFENSGTSLSARHFAARFTDEMRRIGIEVDVIVNTFPQMIQKMRNKDFQVAGLAWGFDYPDAQNILQLLYGPNKSPGINNSNFNDPEFNRLYDEAAVLEDGPARTALYEQMSRIVSDQVPWVTRTHRIRPNLQQPWLTGFKYTEVTDSYWAYAAVDADQRRRLLAAWNQPVRWPLGVAGGGFAALVLVTVIGGRRS